MVYNHFMYIERAQIPQESATKRNLDNKMKSNKKFKFFSFHSI